MNKNNQKSGKNQLFSIVVHCAQFTPLPFMPCSFFVFNSGYNKRKRPLAMPPPSRKCGKNNVYSKGSSSSCWTATALHAVCQRTDCSSESGQTQRKHGVQTAASSRPPLSNFSKAAALSTLHMSICVVPGSGRIFIILFRFISFIAIG